jgi:penicillin-binding protein 1C
VLLIAERVLGWCWPYPLARLHALPVSTVVTAADGTWLRVVPTPAGERVLPLCWRDLSPHAQALVLAAEDERFFAHTGVDVQALARAAIDNGFAGRVVSGASTLTMQVVRLVEPRPRTVWSKCVEVLRARQLERLLDKETIAGVWLTQVPMGGTLRGLEAAARTWFARPLAELDAVDTAALVAMVPAPSLRSPQRRPELLRNRRDALLRRWGQPFVARELGMARHAFPWHAPHLCDAVLVGRARADLPDALPTACEPGLQQRLQQLAATIEAPGDGLAFVVLARGDGSLRALVGDRDPWAPLNLGLCRRSAGSTLKPFLYALAHERGSLGPATLLEDLPRSYDDWQPANFDRRWHGRLRADDALAVSSNLTAVRCLEAVGAADFGELLRRLGLRSSGSSSRHIGDLHLDAALGTDAVTPLGLARAYAAVADRPESVGLSPASATWMLDAMRRLPIVFGRARAGDVAWKSGTSSGKRDAWCVAVTERDVVVVWLGNKDGRGLADLVGVRTATRVCAEVVGLRDGN